jgi:uncharacterized membrane protein
MHPTAHAWKGIFIVFFLVLAQGVAAAHVSGNVVDGMRFVGVENARVRIDSQPPQETLSVDGRYSFEVAPGNYTITATTQESEKTILSTQEKIHIPDEKSYYVDLVLLVEPIPTIAEVLPADYENPDLAAGLQQPILVIVILGLLILGWELAFVVGKKKAHTPLEHPTGIKSIADTLPALPPAEKKKRSTRATRTRTKQLRLSKN